MDHFEDIEAARAEGERAGRAAAFREALSDCYLGKDDAPEDGWSQDAVDAVGAVMMRIRSRGEGERTP